MVALAVRGVRRTEPVQRLPPIANRAAEYVGHDVRQVVRRKILRAQYRYPAVPVHERSSSRLAAAAAISRVATTGAARSGAPVPVKTPASRIGATWCGTSWRSPRATLRR
ncbi:hypothetical protein GCM10027089_40550 [Nocardia thraciensis]